MTALPDPSAACSLVSRENKEPMAGTAVVAHVWFMLSYHAPWQADALQANDLPPSVLHWLSSVQTAVPGSRWQFIKRERPDAGITFFAAVLDDAAPRLYQFQTARYEDLFSLDIASLLTGAGPKYAAQETDGPLYLVCTNGRRDACCARYGLALYRELARHAPAATWQTTHLGGHRFAPTLMQFPHGMSYGRLSPEAIPAFLTSQAKDQILLSYLRGRVCYPRVAQAAESFLRRQTGLITHNSFRYRRSSQIEENLWRVQFTAVPDEALFQVDIKTENRAVYPSCGAVKSKTAVRFQPAWPPIF